MALPQRPPASRAPLKGGGLLPCSIHPYTFYTATGQGRREGREGHQRTKDYRGILNTQNIYRIRYTSNMGHIGLFCNRLLYTTQYRIGLYYRIITELQKTFAFY